jgi:hypothetical protein
MTHRGARLLLLLALGGAAACANILGDFTKGDEGPGGSDASPVDGASTGDAGSSSRGDGGDAGDAARPPAVLTCSLQPSSDLLLGHLARPSDADELYFFGPTATSELAYVVVPGSAPGGNNHGADVFRYVAKESTPSIANIPIPPGQVYDAHRTPDGVAILAMDYGLTGHAQAVVYKLSEAVTDGGIPVWQRIPIGPQDPLPATTCHQSAALLVVDSATDDYIAAVTYNPGLAGCSGTSSPPELLVARTGAGAPVAKWDVPPLHDGAQRLDLQRDGIVLDPLTSRVHVFADQTGNGPIAGVGPFVFTSPATLPPGGGTARAVDPGSTTTFASGLGYIHSPSLGGIDVGMLGGDLTLSGPSIYVGRLTAEEIETHAVSTAYQQTTVSGVEALPVDKGRGRWHVFPGGEHLLLVGRNDLKGGSGVNVYWFDNAGNLRARQAATDAGAGHSALLQGHVVIGADVTFDGPPTGSPAVIGGLLIAATEPIGTDGGVKFFSLTQYNASCTPP